MTDWQLENDRLWKWQLRNWQLWKLICENDNFENGFVKFDKFWQKLKIQFENVKLTDLTNLRNDRMTERGLTDWQKVKMTKRKNWQFWQRVKMTREKWQKVKMTKEIWQNDRLS